MPQLGGLDVVRPLKIESPESGGTQTDFYPTEVSPTEDYVDQKGVLFESDPNTKIDKSGNNMMFKDNAVGREVSLQELLGESDRKDVKIDCGSIMSPGENVLIDCGSIV